mgnify:CR=1 FL=1
MLMPSELNPVTLRDPAAESTVSASAPGKCPRHARKAVNGVDEVEKWIRPRDLWREPFRLFFPIAVLAGIVGVAVWPVMLWGWTEHFPNVIHSRLMIMGFFGGFIFGFLGTSIPRLMDSRPMVVWETVPLLVLHIAMITSYSMNAIGWGDLLFGINLVLFLTVLGARIPGRKDLPAPGFLMIAPGFCCLLTGLGIAEAGRREPLEPQFELLFRLLTYHGFVLLCLLGAGGFLLPRFLGLGLRRKFGENRELSGVWLRCASIALGTGFLIAATYVLDAFEHARVGSTVRAVLVVGYLFWEMPLERLRFSWQGVNWLLITGLVCIPLGILASGWFPALRVGMAHIELIGGFSLITLGVATRVVFGHSGNRDQLERVHPWITTAAVLLLIGASSRVVGEILPHLMISHYVYGALCWLAGLSIWAACVLPKVLKPDPEG